MITLTRLNNRPVVVNEDMIETIEELPDTTVMFFTGNKLIVTETAAVVLAKAAAWARTCSGRDGKRKPSRQRGGIVKLRRR